MCGILGYINHSVGREIFERSLASIAHRGPDASGTFHDKDKNVSLGHRRLSILDLSEAGNQPMFSENTDFVIVYNGEIYNHLDIREKLTKKYTFKSSSDTETILYGYIEYGKDIFAMLNGIFALAIYNQKTGELVIARDQLGVKPLYYYYDGNVLLFSSEMKAITSYSGIDKSINESILVDYIHYLYSPGENTPFVKIKKQKPGTYITVNVDYLSSFSINSFYRIPFDGKYSQSSENELIDELDSLLQKAVSRQLQSDVPVGFFLSGGLDSSLIVAIAQKLRPSEKLKCYTINTDEESNLDGFVGDLHYAKMVAQHLDLDLSVVDGYVDIIRDFDMMIYHMDEPQADPAPLNVLNICRQARKDGFVVLLGGTAGDDLFSGYRRHQALNFEKFIRVIPKRLSKGIKSLLPLLNTKNPKQRRLIKLLSDIDLEPKERMANFYRWLSLDVNKGLFSRDLQEQIKNHDPTEILTKSLDDIPDENAKLNWLLYWDMMYFLTDHNLNYTDKLSMAVGVEVRVPFLDLDLVKFSTSIPVKYKLKGFTTKYILKKVAERYLPKEIIYRSKTGFGAPVREWIVKDLEPMIADYLSPSNINARCLFDADMVWQLIDNNKKGKIDASYTIWSLLAIESWMRQFVDCE